VTGGEKGGVVGGERVEGVVAGGGGGGRGGWGRGRVEVWVWEGVG